MYRACMRTTIVIDDHPHEEACRLACESRRSLSDVINELLAEGLKRSDSTTSRAIPRQHHDLRRLQ